MVVCVNRYRSENSSHHGSPGTKEIVAAMSPVRKKEKKEKHKKRRSIDQVSKSIPIEEREEVVKEKKHKEKKHKKSEKKSKHSPTSSKKKKKKHASKSSSIEKSRPNSRDVSPEMSRPSPNRTFLGRPPEFEGVWVDEELPRKKNGSR